MSGRGGGAQGRRGGGGRQGVGERGEGGGSVGRWWWWGFGERGWEGRGVLCFLCFYVCLSFTFSLFFPLCVFFVFPLILFSFSVSEHQWVLAASDATLIISGCLLLRPPRDSDGPPKSLPRQTDPRKPMKHPRDTRDRTHESSTREKPETEPEKTRENPRKPKKTYGASGRRGDAGGEG